MVNGTWCPSVSVGLSLMVGGAAAPKGSLTYSFIRLFASLTVLRFSCKFKPILPWRKVYGHLAIKLIYWQNTDKQDQSWYSIFSMWSLGLNDSGHAPWHGFVKGFDVLGGDLSPDPSGDFFGLFLKMTYQLQTSVISKRIELEQRDCAHMKDLLM